MQRETLRKSEILQKKNKNEVNKRKKIQSNMVYIINLVHQFCFFIFGKKVYVSITIEQQKVNI